jgi:hypothetical protein
LVFLIYTEYRVKITYIPWREKGEDHVTNNSTSQKSSNISLPVIAQLDWAIQRQRLDYEPAPNFDMGVKPDNDEYSNEVRKKFSALCVLAGFTVSLPISCGK